MRKKVKIADIPLTRIDNQYINNGRYSPRLLTDVKKNGIKYPIEIFTMNPEEAKNRTYNIHRGHRRIYCAKQLGMKEIDAIVGETPSEKPFGKANEQF